MPRLSLVPRKLKFLKNSLRNLSKRPMSLMPQTPGSIFDLDLEAEEALDDKLRCSTHRLSSLAAASSRATTTQSEFCRGAFRAAKLVEVPSAAKLAIQMSSR
jgi:hypothetical protein